MSKTRNRPRRLEDGLSDTLCQECERLCESGFRPYKFLLKDDYQGFLRSARRCALCSLMLASLRRAHGQFDYDHNRLSGFSEQHVGFTDGGATDTSSAKGKRTTFQLSALGMPPNHLGVAASMKYKKDLIETKSKINVFAQPDPDPRLDERAKYELISQWLLEENSSLSTLKASSVSTIPKRLISITDHFDRDSNNLKLIETRDLSQNEQSNLDFVTLSHRWGSSQHFITQKATLNDRCAGFQIGDLPATYRDAVVVTQKLHFRYLWIDAICIVQDDEEDWEQEAVRMGGIYNSAALTIAAHSSTNDDHGFLKVGMERSQAVRIPYDSARKTGKDWHIFGSQIPNFDADVSSSPLCKRAWVLQERLLSPRTLHFTDGFIYWESLQYTRAEDGEVSSTKASDMPTQNILHELVSLQEQIEELVKTKLPYTTNNKSFGMLRAEDRVAKSLASSSLPDTKTTGGWNGTSRFCLADMPELRQILYRVIHGPQQSSLFDRMIVPFDYTRDSKSQTLEARRSSPLDWFKIVEFYSTTSITHVKDRLIAISGLARNIHRRIGVPYYCGLWADRFLVQLLWFRGGSCFDWPAQSRAPSWSWAPVDGEILYPLNVHKISANPSIQVLGLAAEPVVRGAGISRTSWLGGLGSPILQAKIRKFSDSGYWISGDEDLSTGPRKSRQTSFSLLEFRSHILSMQLRYQSRTVGLIVWDDSLFNGDKSPTELLGMVPSLFCVLIAQMEADGVPETLSSTAPVKSEASRYVSVYSALVPVARIHGQSNFAASKDERHPNLVTSPPLLPPKKSENHATEHHPIATDRKNTVFLVLFLIPVDAAESTFRRIGSGQVSPEFAQHSNLWENKTIAII